MSQALQSLVVALVGLVCLWQVLRRYAPRVAWRLQARLAVGLELSRRPGLRKLGRVLRPTEVSIGGGCGGGCGTCGGCASPGGATRP